MKKLLLLTTMIILLSSNAHAFCNAMKPMQPAAYCAGGWQAVCIENMYRPLQPGYWQWVCSNRYGY